MSYCPIAIVDDDLTSRDMLKDLLKGSCYQIVAEFQTPKKAYEWLRTHDISLLLCDMRLPQMNGVELIEMVRIIHPDMPVIAISSFEDFEFARGCIRNNVCDYLLKNKLTQSKLLSVLDKAKQTYHLDKEISTEPTPVVFPLGSNFSLERIEALIGTGQLKFETEATLPILLSLDFPIKTNINWKEYRHDNCLTFIDIINDVLGSSLPHIVHQINDDFVLLILSFPSDSRELSTIQKFWERFTERVRRKCFRLLDLTVTIIIGKTGTLRDTWEQHQALVSTVSGKFLWPFNTTIQFPLTESPLFSKPFMVNGYLDILSFSLRWGYNQFAHDLMESMFQQLEKSGCNKSEFATIATKILAQLETEDIENCISQIQNIASFRELVLQSCDEKILSYSNRIKQIYTTPVFSLLEFVKQNYQQNLSLREYSDSLTCSYTYISREFKEKTGYRFGGCGQKVGLFYDTRPRLLRYSRGLLPPKDILIRFSLYQ